MFVNIIKTYRNVVAVCDSELIEKKFEEKKFQIEVKKSFFKGKSASEKEIIEIIKKESIEDATFNIIGEKSINIALKTGLISEYEIDRKSTRLNSSHIPLSRMPSSALKKK